MQSTGAPATRQFNGGDAESRPSLSCVDFGRVSFYVFTITAMTITELRNIAEGLAKRASRVAAGRKQDSINRGWMAIERVYGYAKATLPTTTAELSLKGEPETWANIARLAGAIVTACDRVETPAPDEIPGINGA